MFPRRRHLYQCSDFVKIGHDTTGIYNKTQKFPRGHSKGTFLEIQLHIVLPQDRETFSEVLDVVFLGLGLHEHVIHVELHAHSFLTCEHAIH